MEKSNQPPTRALSAKHSAIAGAATPTPPYQAGAISVRFELPSLDCGRRAAETRVKCSGYVKRPDSSLESVMDRHPVSMGLGGSLAWRKRGSSRT